MPTQAWSDKRERQYEHIKDELVEHGRSQRVAKEVAARAVNKERARLGETYERKSRTFDQLYAEAKRRKIKGRSKMNKYELEQVLNAH